MLLQVNPEPSRLWGMHGDLRSISPPLPIPVSTSEDKEAPVKGSLGTPLLPCSIQKETLTPVGSLTKPTLRHFSQLVLTCPGLQETHHGPSFYTRSLAGLVWNKWTME